MTNAPILASLRNFTNSPSKIPSYSRSRAGRVVNISRVWRHPSEISKNLLISLDHFEMWINRIKTLQSNRQEKYCEFQELEVVFTT